MKNLLSFSALLGATALTVSAVTITIANPGGTTTEISARIRWGANGFEAALYDGGTSVSNLNPVGTPVWQLNQAYGFMVSFDSGTGTLLLGVDFNRDSTFGAGEVLSQTTFVSPGPTSYQNYGFKYLSIWGQEAGSTARSQVSNLTINGTSLPSLSPNGAFLEQFYQDSSGNPMTSILMTGNLTYLTAGTTMERPSWNFTFKNAEVPPPTSAPDGGTTLVLFGATLAGVALLRRKG